MRSLQRDLGQRNFIFFKFDAGMSFGPYNTDINFNKTPVKAPATENSSLTSLADARIDTPAAFFTSSVINPNTAYSFGNSVSLKPWTAVDSTNSSWAASGAKPLEFGADGNIMFDSLENNPSNPYEAANKASEKNQKDVAKLNEEQQKANAEQMEKLLKILQQCFAIAGGAKGAIPSVTPASSTGAAAPSAPTTTAPTAPPPSVAAA